MKKYIAAAAFVAVLATATSAKALMIAASPVPMRVAAADAVVVGKVAELAEKTESSDLFKGDPRQMQVTTVKVEETISGKKAKTVKVAFFPPEAAPANGGRIRPRLGRGSVQLTKDQEGLFFLTKHPTKKDVYVVQAYFDVVTKAGNTNFGVERDEARRAAKLLADPKKGLESKDAAERLETAAMLLTRYRTPPVGGAKTEPVSAAESKRILTVLAEADWTNVNPRNYMANPMGLFFGLNPQPKDGWEHPKDPTTVQAEAKKWLKANAGKFKIQRFVREADKKTDLEPEPE
jgi:hypothetical protein